MYTIVQNRTHFKMKYYNVVLKVDSKYPFLAYNSAPLCDSRHWQFVVPLLHHYRDTTVGSEEISRLNDRISVGFIVGTTAGTFGFNKKIHANDTVISCLINQPRHSRRDKIVRRRSRR